MNFSTEYAGAIAIVIVSLLKIFGIEIGNDVVTGVITGVIAIVIAIKRHSKGDINVVGQKI